MPLNTSLIRFIEPYSKLFIILYLYDYISYDFKLVNIAVGFYEHIIFFLPVWFVVEFGT